MKRRSRGWMKQFCNLLLERSRIARIAGLEFCLDPYVQLQAISDSAEGTYDEWLKSEYESKFDEGEDEAVA
jgi:hypothetical protein